MEGRGLQEITSDIARNSVDDLDRPVLPPKTYADQWIPQGFQPAVVEQLKPERTLFRPGCEEEGWTTKLIRERLIEASDSMMAQKAEQSAENMRNN